MKKFRTAYIIVAIVLIGLLIGGRMLRQAKSDTLQEGYSGIIPVRGFVLKTQPFATQLEATGVLTGNKESTIAAETGGRVLEVKVDVGDNVQAGQVLVRLDDELLRLESERAKIAFDKAKMDLDRVQKLYDQKSISESEMENAKLGTKGAEVAYRLALKTYNDATVRAPFSGTVAAKMTEVGQMIDRGAPIAQLVDVSSLKLTVSIPELDIKHVSTGSPVQVVVDALNDTLQGTVIAVGSRAQGGTRTFPVEIKLQGGGMLRSGMFARAVIHSGSAQEALLVPRSAVLPDAGRSAIFVARSGKLAEKKLVRIVGGSGDFIVVDGITAGDTVITTGNQSLAQGTTITLTLESGTTP